MNVVNFIAFATIVPRDSRIRLRGAEHRTDQSARYLVDSDDQHCGSKRIDVEAHRLQEHRGPNGADPLTNGRTDLTVGARRLPDGVSKLPTRIAGEDVANLYRAKAGKKPGSSLREGGEIGDDLPDGLPTYRGGQIANDSPLQSKRVDQLGRQVGRNRAESSTRQIVEQFLRQVREDIKRSSRLKRH
ncbi:hypothetical protein G5B46_03935 [Caulobacter sp. 602-2]|uniref:Uncharacterized protein n=1 Tax=Caulobacter sp. 602-2 TaxID=2710887 RepID=A0A6G4QU12_9CAUL|nr:hypothetical protein [Caulobacter sp. 602-2]NGM48745.1 hypothetical protein [Caulobacter sp. 602-2]